MTKNISILSVAIGISVAVFAAEPLVWERVPNRPAPAQFDTYHGETLDFRCTFSGFGALPFADTVPRLYYQTNGMGAAWWSLPATVSSNMLSAAFPPSADPGAERLAVFFGSPSNAYAAAQVRFRNSPGPHPNDLDPPSVIDWQSELVAATNALAFSEREALASAALAATNYTDAATNALSIIASTPPGYETVSNLAMSALQSLEPATNYTDLATNALAISEREALAFATADIALAATNYTDSATNALAISERADLSAATAISPIPGFSDWAYSNMPPNAAIIEIEYYGSFSEPWNLYFAAGGSNFWGSAIGPETATNLTFNCEWDEDQSITIPVTATRSLIPIGYTLGAQSESPFASLVYLTNRLATIEALLGDIESALNTINFGPRESNP